MVEVDALERWAAGYSEASLQRQNPPRGLAQTILAEGAALERREERAANRLDVGRVGNLDQGDPGDECFHRGVSGR